jgi:O-antigen/teichoic acid export membrane protein
VSELQARVDRSTAWVAVASVVLGVLDLISTLVCLRMWVSTAQFGAATLAIALLPILDRLGGMGLGAAIVRGAGVPEAGMPGEGTRADALSSIFWVGIAASTFVFLSLLTARPLIGRLFPDPIVASLLAALGGRLVIQTFGMVPDALMKRDLRYRELSIVHIVACLADTATKLGLAYLGARGAPELAVWCFALGPIANTLVTTIGVQICQRWRPAFVFRRDVAARAVRFTAAVSGGELLYYAYASADYLVVGSYFGDAAVGVYRLAYELVLDVVRLLSMITAEVAFPTFVRLSSDRRAVGAQLLRFTRQNVVVLAPFLVFVGIEADDLLSILYPPLPASAATAARVLCIVGALRTLGFIVPPMLAGIGDASRVFVYNLIAAIVLPLGFVVAAQLARDHGFVAVAWAWAAGYPVAFAALLAMALPRTNLRIRTYLDAIAGIALCAAGALAAGLAVRYVITEGTIVRTFTVAGAVLASYALLLAREGITLSGIVRGLRSPGA